MSNIQYHKGRLDQHFERMANTHPDDERTQRDCLNKIITDCSAISMAPYVYLEQKVMERHRLASAKPDNIPSIVCRDCGDTFPSIQSRNGHMAHCKQKGGGHV